MNKILVILPNANDHAEGIKLDRKKYEIHFMHASDEVKDRVMRMYDYGEFFAKPGFLNDYIERAVKYIKNKEITGVMYGHDMASVVASVICQRTGLRGPSLDATFSCLHKYYSRKINPSSIWFDYINLDAGEETWKSKVHYPCFLKPPCFEFSKGCCTVNNEGEMSVALNNLRELVAPFFKGYSEFFGKYLNLKKFPLAMENIVVVEELVNCRDQYCVDLWADENGVCTIWSAYNEYFCAKRDEDIYIGQACPTFTLSKPDIDKLLKTTEEIGGRFGLRNSFFNIEVWKIGNEFKMVEINSRIGLVSAATYTTMYGISNYEAAIHLACGEKKKIPKIVQATMYQDGEQISGYFVVLIYGEGKAKNLVDFEYARNGCEKDGAYHNGGKGVDLFVDEDTVITNTSIRGYCVCTFLVTSNTPAELMQSMRTIRKKLLLCYDDPNLQIPDV